MEEEAKETSVGGQEAGYLFEFKKDGVFLTVYPSAGNTILYELSDMRQILYDYGVNDYDILTLAKTVRKADGEPVKLSDHFTAPVASGLADIDASVTPFSSMAPTDFAGVNVDISGDKLTATVRYDVTKGTRPPAPQIVRDALEAKGVVYGIDDEAIEKGSKSLESFVAAKGTPAVNGQNAYIDKKFDLSHKGHPKVVEYDRVDYKDMNLFVLAKAGQLIAVRVPQTQGQQGTNVLGKPIAARNGRPIPFTAGKNTEIRDENKLYALIDGQIVEEGKRISVDPHLKISGSVGVGTGNIDFAGSVEITGGVEAGFIVHATGDIQVGDGVAGAEVIGRNVFISGGITGQGRGKIEAREDVRAAFVENGLIEADRDIYISDVVLHSTLKAGKKIIIEDGRGLVTGGYLAAGEEIRAKCIGNQAFVATRLVVGVNPALAQKYQKACREYKEDKQRLEQITNVLNTFSKIDVTMLPQNRIDQINTLTRSQFPLAGKIKRTEKELQKLQEELAKMEGGRIRVQDILYPGVSVSINSVLRNFHSEVRGCTLSVDDDEVKIGPY